MIDSLIRSPIMFTDFCYIDLSITEELLKSPTVIMDLSIFPSSSINFCFVHLNYFYYVPIHLEFV